MEFWFIINGVQTGPYTLEQASQLQFQYNTPVWKTGMPDWTEAYKIPELAEILNQRQFASAGYQPQPVSPAAPEHTGNPSAGYAPSPSEPAVDRQYARQPLESTKDSRPEQEERPSTYLVWSIISTVLCCLPFGVAAIFYSVKAGRNADMGDYVKARKNSEIAQWLIIISITAGIVWSPFYSIFQMLGS